MDQINNDDEKYIAELNKKLKERGVVAETFEELWVLLPMSIEGQPLVLERCTSGPCRCAIITQIRYGSLMHYFSLNPLEAIKHMIIRLIDEHHITLDS